MFSLLLKDLNFLLLFHITKTSVTNTPLHPILYSKTGVYRGIYYFLIFAPKQRLWVLVRTASLNAVLTCTHNQCFEQNKKNIKKFNLKMNIFTAVKYCCILHGRVFVMNPIDCGTPMTYHLRQVCVTFIILKCSRISNDN